MRNVRHLIVVCICLAVLGTVLGGAKSDWDRDVDFSGYRTYSWIEDKSAPDGAKAGLNATGNDLADRRLVDAIDAELAAKGLVLKEGEADLRVAFHLSVNRQTRVTSTGYGYGYRGAAWNNNVSTYSYREGTLVIDMYDDTNDHLVWRGSLTKALGNPKNPEERIQKVVGKILAKYPPAAKK